MRHETVWVDRTIDSNSIKIARVVREATVAVMIEKYRINLTFLLLFASLRFSAPYSSLSSYFTATIRVTVR